MCVRRELVCVQRSHHPHNLYLLDFKQTSHLSHRYGVLSCRTLFRIHSGLLLSWGSVWLWVWRFVYNSLYALLYFPWAFCGESCQVSFSLSLSDSLLHLWLRIWLFVPFSIMCGESTYLDFSFPLMFHETMLYHCICGHSFDGNANVIDITSDVTVTASYRVWLESGTETGFCPLFGCLFFWQLNCRTSGPQSKKNTKLEETIRLNGEKTQFVDFSWEKHHKISRVYRFRKDCISNCAHVSKMQSLQSKVNMNSNISYQILPNEKCSQICGAY